MTTERAATRLNLTPYEQETVINMNNEDDFAIITSYQRTMITSLKKNPAAELVWEALGGACFKVPANLVSVRKPRAPRATTRAGRATRRRRVVSEETRAKLAANLEKARAARHNKNNPGLAEA